MGAEQGKQSEEVSLLNLINCSHLEV